MCFGKHLQPFFTTRKGLGRGIGLTSLQDTVSKSGGAVKISSSVGKGTEVSIFLPEHNQVAANLELVAPLAGTFDQEPFGKGQQILFVGPKSPLYDAVRGAIVELGFATEFCESAEAALRYFSRPGSFDYLISNIAQDSVNGIALYRRVRELQPTLKTILISGRKTEFAEEEQLVQNDNFLRVVRQPFLINRIIRAIEDFAETSDDISGQATNSIH